MVTHSVKILYLHKNILTAELQLIEYLLHVIYVTYKILIATKYNLFLLYVLAEIKLISSFPSLPQSSCQITQFFIDT